MEEGGTWKKKKKKVGCSSSSSAHNHFDQFCKGEIKEKCEFHGISFYRDPLQLQHVEVIPPPHPALLSLGGRCCIWRQISPHSARPEQKKGWRGGDERKRWKHLHLLLSQSNWHSKIQKELVREAILVVCFPLAEKKRKAKEVKGATVQLRDGQLQIQFPVIQRKETVSTGATHCDSLVSRKRDWSTLPKLVTIPSKNVKHDYLKRYILYVCCICEKTSTSDTSIVKACLIAPVTCKRD